MVDADHGQWEIGRLGAELDWNSRLGESRVDIVDGDRVVRVSGVAGDVANDGELPVRRRKRRLVDEGRYLRRQVDAVNKHI